MNTAMTSVELFGVILAAAACMMSVLCMMIGYTAAKHRLFQMMLRYLRLAGMLSMSSWLAMAAVMLRCESKCWVVRQQPLQATPVVEEPVYTVTTPSGFEVEWSKTNAGLFGRMGGSKSTISIGGRGGHSL